MIVILSPSDEQQAQTTARARPYWFATPIFATDGTSRFHDALAGVWSFLVRYRLREDVLYFNVGPVESFLSLLPAWAYPSCALFQWRPLHQQPMLKRWIYWRVLQRSRVLVTYSRDSVEYLRQHFPAKPIIWLGHFIDTEYFSPKALRSGRDQYFLCVGNHKRNEELLIRIAEATKTPILRVSSEPAVERYHSLHPSPLVRLLRDVSFDSLRELYDAAEIVLNAVDDSEWPVGITSFTEALSMDCLIVTSGGHSCSGYLFDDGSRPYFAVPVAADLDAWLAAISAARCQGRNWARGRGPREMAEQFCSLEAAKATWLEVVRLLRR